MPGAELVNLSFSPLISTTCSLNSPRKVDSRTIPVKRLAAARSARVIDRRRMDSGRMLTRQSPES